MLDGVDVDPRFHPALMEQYRSASQSALRATSLPVLAQSRHPAAMSELGPLRA